MIQRVWCSHCGVVMMTDLWALCDHGAPESTVPREMEPLPRWHPLAPSLGPWWVIDMREPFWEPPPEVPAPPPF